MTLDAIVEAIGVTPYFRDDAVVIYHADCRDILPLIPPESVDLVLTDPPYGFGDFDNWTAGEATDTWVVLGQEYARALRGGGSLYSFTGWKFYPQARLAISQHLRLIQTLIWDSASFYQPWHNRWPTVSEPVLYMCKGPVQITTFNRGDIRIPTIHGDPRSNPLGKVPNDVFSLIKLRSNSKEYLEHKGQKPQALIQAWAAASSNPGDLILDPFLGSGTTLRAAKDLGRYAIGIEIEERYCEIAAKRMAQMVMPL